MKKLIFWFFILLLFVFSCSLSTSAAPTDNTSHDTVSSEQSVSSSPPALTASDFADEKAQEDYGAKFIQQQQRQISVVFGILRIFLIQGDETYSYLSPAYITKILYSISFALGLAIFFISWAVSFGKKAIEGDLFEPENGGKKGIIRQLTYLLIGIIVIIISKEIFILIDQIAKNFTLQYLNADISGLETFNKSLAGYQVDYKPSKIPIVGFFINLVNSFSGYLFTIVLQLLLYICAIVIVITLGIRVVKLAIYQGVSPIFMGMAAGDEAQNYTKNFIIQYCILSFQILVISILFTAMQIGVNNIYANLAGGKIDLAMNYTGVIMCIVFTILICKSDKLFEKVFRM